LFGPISRYGFGGREGKEGGVVDLKKYCNSDVSKKWGSLLKFIVD